MSKNYRKVFFVESNKTAVDYLSKSTTDKLLAFLKNDLHITDEKIKKIVRLHPFGICIEIQKLTPLEMKIENIGAESLESQIFKFSLQKKINVKGLEEVIPPKKSSEFE